MSKSLQDSAVEIVKLSEWLDWASGLGSRYVALPMIQRGSVWSPRQIIDLWDSLLRGMPIGGFLVNVLQPRTRVVDLLSRNVYSLRHEGIGLLDGQQRTLTMLLAWRLPEERRMDRRIWVDFLDPPARGYRYRLRVTTESHKFGFRRDEPSRRLSLHDHRQAREAYFSQYENNEVTLARTTPYSASPTLPLDLHWLIEKRREPGLQQEQWLVAVVARLEEFECWRRAQGLKHEWEKKSVWRDLDMAKRTEVQDKVLDLYHSIGAALSESIPLTKIEVAQRKQLGEDEEPELAILFKRVGAGGTALSDADYAYSLIKDLRPECHTLVENLHASKNVASTLSATNLVMTAVRLAAADHGLTDRDAPTKSEYHRLLVDSQFLDKHFFPALNQLPTAFAALHGALLYSDSNANGIPLLAFPYLRRPLVQVLLRWLFLKPDVTDDDRGEMLRFSLFWMLCVTDGKKASVVAFKMLRTSVGEKLPSRFPGKTIGEALVGQGYACPLASPETLEQVNDLVRTSSPKERPMRGWNSRFGDDPAEDKVKQTLRRLYSRWWNNGNGHTHPMLLWLQREYLDAKFDANPLAGRDEDTPYDYDHILPANHWGNWTGSGAGARLLEFTEPGAHRIVGNGIGNVRIWGSSDNRSDGDKPPSYKLALKSLPNENPAENIEGKRFGLLRDSCVSDETEHCRDWELASGELTDFRKWTRERALAFQRAVEHRSFRLYERYFNEAGFALWCGNDGLMLSDAQNIQA